MNYFIDAFKNFAEFSGRNTRKQYWMFVLFYIIIYSVLAVLDSVMGSMVLTSIFSLVAFVPSVSIAARRLHDVGKSGWWQLIVLIPLIGLIVLVVFLCQDSEGDNEFGSRPE